MVPGLQTKLWWIKKNRTVCDAYEKLIFADISMKVKRQKIFTLLLFMQVLPLENKMKNRDQFRTVLVLGMVIVCCLYFAMGLLGYLCFGTELEDTITLNLPDTL